MAQYKAKEGFAKLEDKFFGPHKIKYLENGGVIEITNINSVPKKVKECLEIVEAPKPKKKGDK